MTLNGYKTVTYNNKCIVMIKDIEAGEYYGTDFIKKNKLTIVQFHTVESVLSELWNSGKSLCFDTEVAKLFEKYGFSVNHDEHSINFVIS